MIRATVCSGAGNVSKAVTGPWHAAREEAAGTPLSPGTLNARPDEDPADAATSLGPPAFETDQDNERLGPLRWWPVVVSWEAGEASGFLVRHPRSRASYLEIMAETHFRSLGLADGDTLHIRRADGTD